MSLIKEFKEFAVKGNVIDLAVGVVIGGAFGKIVSSLVSDVINPVIGLLISQINLTEIKLWLIHEQLDSTTQKVLVPGVSLNIGNFVQNIIDFTLVAFAIFLVVKAVNRFKRKQISEAAPAPNQQEVLLTEIRDLLKSRH